MRWSNKPRITVYADLSCPFCFVLHERLLAMDLISQVEWRTIEHAPGANAVTCDPRQITQLNQEYRLILKRASDVKVINPGFIPNTALVNQYLFSLSKLFPETIEPLRTLIYRALWQQGLDISSVDVLSELLQQLQLPMPTIDDSVVEGLARWQRKWQFADFDLRIPVMLRDQTEIMLGLQHVKSIEAFIDFKQIANLKQGDICQYISKDIIMVLCEPRHRATLETLAEGEKISMIFYHDKALFVRDLATKAPDLVLLDEHIEDCFDLCQQIKNLSGSYRHLPLVVFGLNPHRDEEKRAFHTGVVDYICLETQAEVLINRLKNHIRCKHQLEILSDHAAHDGLTGLYNKRELENCLEREWRYGCRYRHSIGILMLDIDHFKAFNDHYGHPAGDEALVRVAGAISGCIFRGTDLVARFGGEEFAVILPKTDEQSLMAIAQRMQQSVEQMAIEHYCSEFSNHLTVSIGAALTQAHADNNYMMLLELADKCLYQAKREGRNNVKFDRLASPEY